MTFRVRLAVTAVVLGLIGPFADVANAQAPPPLPTVYSGTVTAAGAPVPDSVVDENGACLELCITARIGGDYQSQPRPVKNGRYTALNVGPPDTSLTGETVTFHLNGVQAQETDTFIAAALPTIKFDFNLTFPNLPEPTPTPTPTVTPTPVVAQPAVYSGVIAVIGGAVPEGAVLVARVGTYESSAAVIKNGAYSNLVLLPPDISFAGQAVEFFLNGVKSTTDDTYRSGSFTPNFILVFEDLPTPTPTPTATPTGTPVPPTATATATPTATASATATASPTSTATPTATPVPPTRTAVVLVVTATPLPPTATTTPTPPSGGGCFAASGDAPLMAGLGNLLFLLGPLGLIAGLKRRRR